MFTKFAQFMATGCLLLAMTSLTGAPAMASDAAELKVETSFVADDGRDLRAILDSGTRKMLTPAHGVGAKFGPAQKARYCKLKSGGASVQWVVNDLKTGEVRARSANAEKLYFGASVSKLFVAAAFLDTHKAQFTQQQLRELVRMIVVSDNVAWKSLQRQTGGSESNYAGRVAVQAFVKRMGYPTIKGFQGWMKHRDGTQEHGNELNTLELSRFLFDTYQRKYVGADVLWEIMRATRTGRSKIGKYTPADLRIGGKTGTYSGRNESPETIHLPTIGSRNHAAVLFYKGGIYGISVLANTASSEDVAILGGGLMRDYLGVEPAINC
ncbi:MAG: serine hydrolase [Anderseniella sp.]